MKPNIVRKGLIDKFAEAGLKLELISKPPRLGDSELLEAGGVFTLDIKRKLKGNMRSEYFEMHAGGDENIITVLAIDKHFHQLVLMVKEVAQTFKVKVRKTKWTSTPRGRIVSQNADHWVVEEKTSNNKRHFLLGVDERQLFMCQLPKACTTVQQAHDSLKSPTVILAEGKTGRASRQGEWFFLNATEEETTAIEQGIKDNLLFIRTKVGINRIFNSRGKPHVADELVTIPGKPLGHGHPVRASEVFIRGSVRHPDHDTVKFSQWKKVIRNAETTQDTGGSWID